MAGGLGGRLLGGWLHPPLHWRYAFVSASALVIAATLAASLRLPGENTQQKAEARRAGFLQMLAHPGLLRKFAVAFGAFFVFSSTFNYLPFYLSGPPIAARTRRRLRRLRMARLW